MTKVSKKRYLQCFGLVVIALAIVRVSFPQITGKNVGKSDTVAIQNKDEIAENRDSIELVSDVDAGVKDTIVKPLGKPSIFFNADGTLVKNRIYSVPHFGNAFPDQNDVQLVAATKHGVSAVIDRADVDKLKSSIPYLVPRAAVLLQDIGRNFFDSLQTKQIPLHKVIVTSVLRSKSDVAKLRSHNGNATENSCHLYGTTFDICYNRYLTVEDPEGVARRKVRNDTLKWVLSEVLNDMRKNQRCYVKYEVKQGCFHITVN